MTSCTLGTFGERGQSHSRSQSLRDARTPSLLERLWSKPLPEAPSPGVVKRAHALILQAAIPTITFAMFAHKEMTMIVNIKIFEKALEFAL